MEAVCHTAEACPPRVLVAEDQPHVREALRLLLKGAGYRITDVSTPSAVLTELAAQRYDALLLDLNYARDTTSGTEGLELLPSIRQLDRTIPVLVLTAWGTVDIAVEAMHCGADDFIQKPWDNARLLSQLRARLERGQDLRRSHLQRELESQELRDIQRALLPREIPRIAGCEIAVDWRPAGDVGGDYFDALKYGESSAGLCIADVAGKGVTAALLMSNLQAHVRALASETISPKDLCRQLNQLACANAANGRFISFFYVRLDARQHGLACCNAGHNAPILVRADGTCERLKQGGPVLGEFPEAGYESEETVLRPGDRLVLFTDGITEARDADGREFGEVRLVALVQEHRRLPSSAMQRRILGAVRAHGGDRLQDDATLMIIAID